MIHDSKTPNILIIDDDEAICDLISAAASKDGIRSSVLISANGFNNIYLDDFDLIMLDLRMQDMDGIEILRLIASKSCKSKIVIMSGIGMRVLENAKQLGEGLNLQISTVLQKPFHIADLEQIFAGLNKPNDEIKIKPNNYKDPQDEFKDITIQELQEAISAQQLLVYYQPQIHIKSNKVIGLEALVRWEHPVHGLIFPDNFIHFAEENGLIDQIGWVVLQRASTEIRDFFKENNFTPTLSINISPYSLQDLQFPDSIALVIKQKAIDPQNIVLEITETGIFKDLNKALDIVTRLRIKQFQLSIDDFGSGYAMLEQLKNIPANELKIDRSLLQKLLEQQSVRIMAQKIVELGHDLGMRIVAEGVETSAQLNFLREIDCDIAQGYYFSKPLPMNDLIVWYKRFVSK